MATRLIMVITLMVWQERIWEMDMVIRRKDMDMDRRFRFDLRGTINSI